MLTGGKSLDPYTHIWIFDACFTYETTQLIAARLANSPSVRVLVSCRPPDYWEFPGLTERMSVVSKLKFHSSGGPEFTCHIYNITD